MPITATINVLLQRSQNLGRGDKMAFIKIKNNGKKFMRVNTALRLGKYKTSNKRNNKSSNSH